MVKRSVVTRTKAEAGVLHLQWVVSVREMVVVLHFQSALCHQHGKLGDVTCEPLYYFLQMYRKLQLLQN